MDGLNLDEDLLATLKGVRESVRQLFEQLRLRHEDGDIPGKARLERVPALAKRNFANLTNDDAHLAIKEAWRLIDFLEDGDEARLSPRAREAMRTIELDKQLAALRRCERWKQAAIRLRETVGDRSGAADLPPVSAEAMTAQGDAPLSAPGSAVESRPIEAPAKRPLSRRRPRRPMFGPAAGLAILLAAGALTASRWFGTAADPRTTCLALENASPSALAAHWSGGLGVHIPLPPSTSDARPHVFTISDNPGGGPVRSTWTTSRYSYAERTTKPGPGGGASDFRLRVGGWDDTYVALLQVPIPTNRLVRKAVLRLRVLGDEARSRPTSLVLRAIIQSWRVYPGAANHPWWRDCPLSHVVRTHLPPPGPPESVYDIDITDLYNLWARGLHVTDGIMLEPEHIGRWGPDAPQFGSFDTFYSTRASEPANRPQLILTY